MLSLKEVNKFLPLNPQPKYLMELHNNYRISVIKGSRKLKNYPDTLYS